MPQAGCLTEVYRKVRQRYFVFRVYCARAYVRNCALDLEERTSFGRGYRKAKGFYCIFLDCLIYNARLQWFLFRPAWVTEFKFL
jgi:hypothetical protein